MGGHVDEIAHPGAHIGVGERGQGQRALQGHARILAGGQGEALGLVEEGVSVQQRGVELATFARGQGGNHGEDHDLVRREAAQADLEVIDAQQAGGIAVAGLDAGQVQFAGQGGQQGRKSGVHGRGSLLGDQASWG